MTAITENILEETCLGWLAELGWSILQWTESGSRNAGGGTGRLSTGSSHRPIYQFRHMVNGNRIEESFGWMTQGWNEAKCILEMAKIQQAKKTGVGPASLREQREKAAIKRKEIELEQMTVNNAWERYEKISPVTFGEKYPSKCRPDYGNANETGCIWGRCGNCFSAKIKKATVTAQKGREMKKCFKS